MYEVELKFPISQSPVDKLEGIGAYKIIDERRIADTYYAMPDNSSMKVFRIREVANDHYTWHFLTCKGKPLATTSKTRREIEIEVDSNMEQLTAFVELLGYTPIGVVEKLRAEWRGPTVDGFTSTICIDTLDIGLGFTEQYLEVELIVDSEDQCELASDAIMKIAEELGLGIPEHRSYFELVHGRKKNA